MADYDMEKEIYELNFESARLAKEACVECTAKDPTRPRFVMGALGPTNRTGSISPVIIFSITLDYLFFILVRDRSTSRIGSISPLRFLFIVVTLDCRLLTLFTVNSCPSRSQGGGVSDLFYP